MAKCSSDRSGGYRVNDCERSERSIQCGSLDGHLGPLKPIVSGAEVGEGGGACGDGSQESVAQQRRGGAGAAAAVGAQSGNVHVHGRGLRVLVCVWRGLCAGCLERIPGSYTTFPLYEARARGARTKDSDARRGKVANNAHSIGLTERGQRLHRRVRTEQNALTRITSTHLAPGRRTACPYLRGSAESARVARGTDADAVPVRRPESRL